MTRRAAAQLFGAMPFLSRGAAEGGAGSLNTLIGRQIPGPWRESPSDYATGSSANTASPAAPLMPEHEAIKFILQNAEAYALYESEMYRAHRCVEEIEPDILIYKSFSPMAKLTFQRQRNVKRHMVQLVSAPKWLSMEWFHLKVRKVMWGE
jgi:hypothetical protein